MRNTPAQRAMFSFHCEHTRAFFGINRAPVVSSNSAALYVSSTTRKRTAGVRLNYDDALPFGLPSQKMPATPRARQNALRRSLAQDLNIPQD